MENYCGEELHSSTVTLLETDFSNNYQTLGWKIFVVKKVFHESNYISRYYRGKSFLLIFFHLALCSDIGEQFAYKAAV